MQPAGGILGWLIKEPVTHYRPSLVELSALYDTKNKIAKTVTDSPLQQWWKPFLLVYPPIWRKINTINNVVLFGSVNMNIKRKQIQFSEKHGPVLHATVG